MKAAGGLGARGDTGLSRAPPWTRRRHGRGVRRALTTAGGSRAPRPRQELPRSRWPGLRARPRAVRVRGGADRSPGPPGAASGLPRWVIEVLAEPPAGSRAQPRRGCRPVRAGALCPLSSAALLSLPRGGPWGQRRSGSPPSLPTRPYRLCCPHPSQGASGGMETAQIPCSLCS